MVLDNRLANCQNKAVTWTIVYKFVWCFIWTTPEYKYQETPLEHSYAHFGNGLSDASIQISRVATHALASEVVYRTRVKITRVPKYQESWIGRLRWSHEFVNSKWFASALMNVSLSILRSSERTLYTRYARSCFASPLQ